MAIERWVVNASPLILLGKVDHLDLLFALTECVIVPQAVADEIRAKPVDIQIFETLTRHVLSSSSIRMITKPLNEQPTLATRQFTAAPRMPLES